MSVRSLRTTVRLTTVVAALPTALTLLVLPAQATPTEGDPVAAVDPCWRNDEGRPLFYGHRYGCDLAPEDRGPVMEFLEP
jgi:hypothetical protein